MPVQKPSADPTVHNYSTYQNHKCRCDVCRAANAEYVRARTAKARDRRRLVEAGGGRNVVDGIKHGEAGYRNHHCRCDICRLAHNEGVARRARVARARRAANPEAS